MFNIGDVSVLTDNQGNKHLGKISVVCPNGTVFGIIDSIGMGWTTNDPSKIRIIAPVTNAAPVTSQPSDLLQVGAYVSIKHPTFLGCSLQGYLTTVNATMPFYQITSTSGDALNTNNPLDITLLKVAEVKKFKVNDSVSTIEGDEGLISYFRYSPTLETWDYLITINGTTSSKWITERWVNKLDHLHNWKEYVGFTDRYEYCQICDLKRK